MTSEAEPYSATIRKSISKLPVKAINRKLKRSLMLWIPEVEYPSLSGHYA
jgi:hypothetical protein